LEESLQQRERSKQRQYLSFYHWKNHWQDEYRQDKFELEQRLSQCYHTMSTLKNKLESCQHQEVLLHYQHDQQVYALQQAQKSRERIIEIVKKWKQQQKQRQIWSHWKQWIQKMKKVKSFYRSRCNKQMQKIWNVWHITWKMIRQERLWGKESELLKGFWNWKMKVCHNKIQSLTIRQVRVISRVYRCFQIVCV
jgi:hypothetical protein